ncbi:Uncharacterised protein [Candidatus Venteria ishoeyi]|uniref:Uncharacterized protein n=1 Tax=Candidatus Venteria ishoeyi TaxID=1899563 RepID=A0A1H6F7Q7_9GAMM|nr:Uncharacterised protein [Candidatus Venteria ishoeyi]
MGLGISHIQAEALAPLKGLQISRRNKHNTMFLLPFSRFHIPRHCNMNCDLFAEG